MQKEKQVTKYYRYADQLVAMRDDEIVNTTMVKNGNRGYAPLPKKYRGLAKDVLGL